MTVFVLVVALWSAALVVLLAGAVGLGLLVARLLGRPTDTGLQELRDNVVEVAVPAVRAAVRAVARDARRWAAARRTRRPARPVSA